MTKQAEKHIKHDHRAGIADMGEIINGWAAHVHPHVARIERNERLFGAGQGIVKCDGLISHGWLPWQYRLPDR